MNCYGNKAVLRLPKKQKGGKDLGKFVTSDDIICKHKVSVSNSASLPERLRSMI